MRHPREQAVARQADGSDARRYHRFLLAAIVFGLTAGAAWGIVLLWRIGVMGSYTAVPIHHVNAHGHAQIFGWVGLFVMGASYGLLPRLWRATLAWPRAAWLVLLLMVSGTTVRTGGMAMPDAVWASIAMLLGGGAQLAAVTTFGTQILTTYARGDGRIAPWTAFILTAIGWFVLMTAASVWYAWLIATATTRQEMLGYVMAYQAPLRDVQLRGFALFVMLGLSLRLLPQVLTVPVTSDRRGWLGLVVLTVAVVGMVLLFVAYQWTGATMFARALLPAWLMLAAGVAIIAWPWRLWRPGPWRDGSAKFVRAAYLWLAISLTMLVLLPLHQWLSGIPFSHAYYGAVRHAMGVGFVSMMIVGLASPLARMLDGSEGRCVGALWGPFVLINVGCALRVSLQTVSDWHSGAFAWVGVSGVLELAGLAWWAGHMLMPIHRAEAIDEPVRVHGDDATGSDTVAT